MKKEWQYQAGYYKASIPLTYLSGNFVYTSFGTMTSASPVPCGRICNGWNDDVFSCDVIVCGDEENKQFVLAGALTAFRSLSFFTVKYRFRQFTEIEVQQPDIKAGEKPEELIILEGSDWRELLFEYADLSAEKVGVKKISSAKNMTGYCSWYYYYKDVTQAHLLENVEALVANRSVFAADYVQIDDGYQTRQGDWLERHANWPVPLDAIAKKITDNGMTAGIWIMPFVASSASKVYQEHPEWFVKDENGGTVTKPGWTPAPDNHWACLDLTQEVVQKHLQHVFRTFRSMGFTYFKMDGLCYGLQQGVRQDRNATSVSAFRQGLKAIRDAVPDCLLMACSGPFMPVMGLVDNVRVSNDTSRYFMNNPETRNFPIHDSSISAAARLSLSHFWKFDRWYRCDPDVLMARQDNAFYTRGEAKISVLSGIMTGVCITSDHLGTIASDRLDLLGKAQNLRMCDVKPVLTGYKCEWPSIYEGTLNGQRALALLNETPSSIRYIFSDLNLPDKCVDLLDEKKYFKEFELPSHDAVLLTAEN